MELGLSGLGECPSTELLQSPTVDSLPTGLSGVTVPAQLQEPRPKCGCSRHILMPCRSRLLSYTGTEPRAHALLGLCHSGALLSSGAHFKDVQTPVSVSPETIFFASPA